MSITQSAEERRPTDEGSILEQGCQNGQFYIVLSEFLRFDHLIVSCCEARTTDPLHSRVSLRREVDCRTT